MFGYFSIPFREMLIYIHVRVLQLFSLFQEFYFLFSVYKSQNDGSFHLSIPFGEGVASSDTLLVNRDIPSIEELDHLGGIAQKQDKGLSWDFPVILAEFSPDSVARMEAKLIYIKLLWRFTLCS